MQDIITTIRKSEELALSIFTTHMKYAEAIYLGPSKEFTFLITTPCSLDPWFWVPNTTTSKLSKVVCMQKIKRHVIIRMQEETDITQLNYAVYRLLKRLVYYDPKRDLLVCY